MISVGVGSSPVAAQRNKGQKAALSVSLGMMRVLFGTLERVAPTLGAALAMRIICTPSRASLPDLGIRGGRRFTVAVDGNPVTVEEWGAGPAVYLLHGWGRERRDFDAFVSPLLEGGFRVVAIDAPAHGETGPGTQGGRRVVLPEFVQALSVVIGETGPAYGIVAHSAGGACAALAVLDGLPTERLVLIAPLGNFLHEIAKSRLALGYGDRIESGLLQLLERRAGRAPSDFHVAAGAAGRSDLPPLLVVHDQMDRRNPYTDGMEIVAAWPLAEMRSTTELGHLRILRDSFVVKTVVSFLREPRAVGVPTN